MKLKFISTLGAATLAFTFSACDTSKYVTVNTGNANANKAVVTNANSTANTNANATGNTVSNANAATTTAADGTVLSIDEAGVSMIVPKGMNFSKEGKDTIVKTDDDGVDTRFTVLSDEDMEKAFDDAFKEIDEYIKNAKFASKEPKKTMQNGLEVNSWSGTGKATNGDSVQFQLAIVSVPDSPKKPLLALTYAEGESLESHKAELDKFFNSIKKQ